MAMSPCPPRRSYAGPLWTLGFFTLILTASCLNAQKTATEIPAKNTTTKTATGTGNVQEDTQTIVAPTQQGGVNAAVTYTAAGSGLTGMLMAVMWIVSTFRANRRDHDTFRYFCCVLLIAMGKDPAPLLDLRTR